MGNQCAGKRECCYNAADAATTPRGTPRSGRKPVVGEGPASDALQGIQLDEKERRELSKVDKEVKRARDDLKDAQMEIARLEAEVEHGRRDRQMMTQVDQEIQKAAINLKEKRNEVADLRAENERLRKFISEGAGDVIQRAATDLRDAKQEITYLREENMKMKDMIAAKYAVGGQ
eukprot:gnl/MRDRNA2_/MRDRNA2_87379_c0_seq1.p1 gnl/MRDRNA2_/MRDRNA2_87379_c0~~gnl/MRDRNA2_/MRDRNA2_87379_c0_seq1.p1  ORF type:complete len:175 (+),score=44.34 gnl/MRDRNA2_/MRDRNA2_87379_c0_seq1:89-613(+)